MANNPNRYFAINYTKAADKFFFDHEDVRTQYESAIRELLTGDHPEAIDCKRIKAKHADYYRIRIGKYRVIYTIIGRQIVVVNTLLAGSRGDVYKKMGGMK